MSERLPNLCYYSNDEFAFNKPYSEHTAEVIDQEVQKMINEQYVRAKELLQKHSEGHAQLAQVLIDREVIYAEDVEKIFGKRPWTSRSEEIMAEENGSQPAAIGAEQPKALPENPQPEDNGTKEDTPKQ